MLYYIVFNKILKDPGDFNKHKAARLYCMTVWVIEWTDMPYSYLPEP